MEKITVLKMRLDDANEAWGEIEAIWHKLYSEPPVQLTEDEKERLAYGLTKIAVALDEMAWDAYVSQSKPKKFRFWKR